MSADLERRLLVEAGHRCAVPTCRAEAPLTIDHIEDWSRVKCHEFENLIVLCTNCHGRKGNKRGQIDRKSLREYKAKLALIGGYPVDAGCSAVKPPLRALEKLVDHVYFRDSGMFTDDGITARDALDAALHGVVDRQLKAALLEVVAAFDATHNAALPPGGDIDKQTWMVALTHIDLAHPSYRLKAYITAATDRVSALGRQAAGV